MSLPPSAPDAPWTPRRQTPPARERARRARTRLASRASSYPSCRSVRRAARRRASFAAATLQWKRCDVRESAGMSSGCTAGSRHVSAAASSRGAHAGCGEYRFGEGRQSGSSSKQRFASFMGACEDAIEQPPSGCLRLLCAQARGATISTSSWRPRRPTAAARAAITRARGWRAVGLYAGYMPKRRATQITAPRGDSTTGPACGRKPAGARRGRGPLCRLQCCEEGAGRAARALGSASAVRRRVRARAGLALREL